MAASGAAVLCIPVAIVLVLFAVDVLRVGGAVEGDDVRFQARAALPDRAVRDRASCREPSPPRRSGSRTISAIAAPSGSTRAQTRATRPCTSRLPKRPCARASSRSSSTRAGRRPIPRRRSRLLNLLGVVAMSRYAVDPGDRSGTVRAAIDSFSNAIKADPDNADAKFNLEIVLRELLDQVAPAAAPDRGRLGGRVAGVGRDGCGLLMDLTFLTPLAVIFAVSALLPLSIYLVPRAARGPDPERAEAGGAFASLPGPARRRRRCRSRAAGHCGGPARARHGALGAGADGRRGVLRHGHVALDARFRRRRTARHASTGRSRRPRRSATGSRRCAPASCR